MSELTTFRVAGVQMEPRLGRLEENLDVILERLGHAAAAGAQLAVFPECALSGYGFSSREEGFAHAVPVDGPEVDKVVALAAKTGCALRLRALGA